MIHFQPMHRSISCVAIAAALLLAGCLPEPPKPPPEIGVHVASGADDSARIQFTVTVTGSLVLGVRSRQFGMRPDKSLLLSTPADVVVNKGAGSAVIVALDSSGRLAISPLDRADSATATARGRAVRITRVGNTQHLIAAAVPDTLIHPRSKR